MNNHFQELRKEGKDIRPFFEFSLNQGHLGPKVFRHKLPLKAEKDFFQMAHQFPWTLTTLVQYKWDPKKSIFFCEGGIKEY